ncbi:MAG: hypothetical protein IPM74_10025 [Crocinitomicaceae bacterium]|nr:hypothetical protein [Crocinitomicaceae bacterium]MBK8926230.1 hypothetical protein [Crocinitomicaceae bacterium]
MKKFYTTISVMAISWLGSTALGSNHFTLDTLLKQGVIQASFEGLGGYQENCVQLIVKNNSHDSVYGFVEPGRRLVSADESEQDIFVVKSALFALAPGKRDTVLVHGFCCESTKAAPQKGSVFLSGFMAPVAWVFIANLIDKNKFSKDAVQHAVWVLSDKHDIRSIPAYSNPAMDALRHAVADILDIELPWYSFLYKEGEGELFSGIKTHFFAEVDFSIPKHAMISTEVRDESGHLIYADNPQWFGGGDHTLRVKFPIAGWDEKGYRLSIMEDLNTLNTQRSFTLKDQP